MKLARGASCALIVFACSAAAAESTNQWYPRGPDGGYAHAVAIDPASHALIAGGIAGVFRYDSQASVWGFANSGAPTPIVGDIATTASATFVDSGGYVARSTDGGVTWTNVSSPLMGANVVSIATSANAPARVYAAVNPGNNDPSGGLWISSDSGNSWTQSAVSSGSNLSLVRVSPTNANVIYATDYVDGNGIAKLYRSTDGGTTFGPVVQSSGSYSTLALEFVDVQQDPFDATRVVALTAPIALAFTDRSQGGEVFVSHDGGATFDAGSNNNFVLAPETTGGGEPRSLLFDRFTQNVVYFTTTWGVFKSVNSPPALASTGLTRLGMRTSGAQPYDEVDRLVQAIDGTLYAATSSGGVYASADGAANWTAQTAGFTSLSARIFAFQPGNTGVVLAGMADPSTIGYVYRSTDGGTSWTRSSNGMNASNVRGLAFSPTDPNLVIAGALIQAGVGGESSQGIWRSTDAGVNWTPVNDAGLRSNNKRIVVFDPNDGNKVLVTAPTRINVSSNAGVNWVNSINASGSFGGLPFANNPDLTLLGLAAGPKPGGGTRFYVGVINNSAPGSLPMACQNDGSLPCKGGVYYSDDGGFHWTRGTGVPQDSVSYVSVGATAGTVFAGQSTNGGYAGGVFKSTDYGATWSDSSTGLTCRNMYSVVATDPVDGNVAWSACNFIDVAHPGGIFRTSDGGASWVPYGRGLRNPSIAWMAVDPGDGTHVFAGGWDGVHEMHFAPDADLDGIPDSEEAQFASGDANGDGTQDAAQSYVASVGTTTPAGAPAPKSVTASDYVVVEIDREAAFTGTCEFVSDLELAAAGTIPAPNNLTAPAPSIRFTLPNCSQAHVKIRYSSTSSYPVPAFAVYSPKTLGDAATLRWGLLDPAVASVDGNGVWSLALDENAYGNVYAPGTGSIRFQGAPGTDSIFAGSFD